MDFLYFLESLRTPWLDAFMSAITMLGSEKLFIILAVVVMWCISKDDGYYMLFVSFTGIIINQALKIICRVPRPWIKDPDFKIVESARAEATGYSFPSGHTQNVVSIGGSIAILARKKWVTILCCSFIALTAFSRMYLGVHTPADVITSLLIGSVLVIAFRPLFNKIKSMKNGIFWAILVMAVISAAYLMFLTFYSFPADTDVENYNSALENGYTLLGAVLAFLICHPIERKFIKYQTKDIIPIQIAKCAVGLLIILALTSLLKEPLNTLFGGHYIARAIRYFIVVVVAALAYPATFSYWHKLGTKLFPNISQKQ